MHDDSRYAAIIRWLNCSLCLGWHNYDELNTFPTKAYNTVVVFSTSDRMDDINFSNHITKMHPFGNLDETFTIGYSGL